MGAELLPVPDALKHWVKREQNKPGFIWYLVIGPLGAVQFMVMTGVGLPASIRNMPVFSSSLYGGGEMRPMYPFPADLGYHAPRPRFDGQAEYECDLLPSGKCYYDGSTLNAERVFPFWRDGLEDALFSYLEEYYGEVLGGRVEEQDI